MTSVKCANKTAVQKAVRKISLERDTPRPSDVETQSLRRVRSDSMTPGVHTLIPEFLRDKDCSPKIKMNLGLPNFTLFLGGDSAKHQSKKHVSGQKGAMVNGVPLHWLRNKEQFDDRKSVCSSLQSVRTSPSPDLGWCTERGNYSHPRPSLTIAHSPDDDQVSCGDESDTSSVYHSSYMYQPEEEPKVVGHFLGDPRKSREHCTLSPIVQDRKQQQGTYRTRLNKMMAFLDGKCSHSSQDITNLPQELTALPSISKYCSTKETLATTLSCPASAQGRDNQDAGTRERTSTLRPKDCCDSQTQGSIANQTEGSMNSQTQGSMNSQTQGSMNSQTQGSMNSQTQGSMNSQTQGSMNSQTQGIIANQIQGKRLESRKNRADQTCRSNFGLLLSGICFVLFLWYLAVVCRKFIKSALSLEPFDKVHSDDLGVVQEVVVYIVAEDTAV